MGKPTNVCCAGLGIISLKAWFMLEHSQQIPSPSPNQWHCILMAQPDPWCPGQVPLLAYLFRSPKKFLGCFILNSLVPLETVKLTPSLILLESRERSCLVNIKPTGHRSQKRTETQRQPWSPLTSVSARYTEHL